MAWYWHIWWGIITLYSAYIIHVSIHNVGVYILHGLKDKK